MYLHLHSNDKSLLIHNGQLKITKSKNVPIIILNRNGSLDSIDRRDEHMHGHDPAARFIILIQPDSEFP